MPRYKISVMNKHNNAKGTFFKYGNSPDAIITEWYCKHPETKIISILEVESEEKIQPVKPCKCKKEITSHQWRNHHKARITQMRNNALSLMEDEEAILTDSERLQLSRIACQFDRILALWAGRSMDLNIINHKK